MMRLFHCHQQRFFFSAARHCHTDVQLDAMIGRSKIKGIPPSQINPKADKMDSNTSQIDYFKEPIASAILAKSYVNSSHSTSSLTYSNLLPKSYTKISPNELETSALISRENYLNEVMDLTSEREQLLKLALPFDEVPGPKILKMAAKAYSYLPIVGTHITTAAMMYFLNMLGTNLIWNRSARPFIHMFDKYGPVVRLQGVFGGNLVFVSHPEHIQTVFQHEGRYPVRSTLDSIDKYRTQYRNTQMVGPFIMSGPEWEVLRKNIEASFGSIAFQYHNKLESTANEMITRIRLIKNRQEEVPNTFNEDIYKWALENTCLVLLGNRLGLLDSASLNISSESVRLLEAVQNASKALRNCESGLQLWRFFETKQWHSLVVNCDIIDSIVAKYVRSTQNNLDNKKEDMLLNMNTEHSSMLEMLLLKGELQPNDIMTIMLDTFLIGVNAICHALSFLLYHLAKNPWVQRKAFHEIVRLMPEKDSTLSYSSLLHMPYTQACLQESLRLQPPIPVITRVLPHDIALYSYRIPKGTYMLLTSHVTSRREENFEDAHKFKPERWLSDDESIHPFAALPFGHGARACVGRRFAELQLWLMTAKVIRNFHIEYHYGNIHARTRFIAMPSKPLKFRFVERLR